jgi:hypothetical protein
MASADIENFVSDQKETLAIITMLGLHGQKREAEERKVLQSMLDFIVERSLALAQMVMLFAILPIEVLERLLKHDNQQYRIAAVRAFDGMEMDETVPSGIALGIYTRARDLGLATALTLRLFLFSERRGFFNQYDRRHFLPQLYAQSVTADHIFAALHDQNRSVIAGALEMIDAGLQELLDGRFAKTEEGYRFPGSYNAAERQNSLWAAQWMSWPCYVREVKYQTLVDSQCHFLGAYRSAMERKKAGLVSDAVDAESMYFHWRQLAFAHFDRLLDLLDHEPSGQSLNALVFRVLARLACDSDREVSELFLRERARIQAFDKTSALCTVHSDYNYGIGELSNRYPQFEAQLAASK